jgi:uncharacterized protein YoxC
MENTFYQFGLLGIIIMGAGYGIIHSSKYLAKKVIEPLTKKHLELLDTAIDSLKNFGNSLATLNMKVDDIHTRINEKLR